MKKVMKDIQKKDVKELTVEIQKTIEEIAKMALDSHANPIKDSNTLHKKRKHVARLKTALSMKKEVK
jgi:ribosomal protein L29